MTKKKDLDAKFAKLSPQAQTHANNLMRQGAESGDAIARAKRKYNEEVDIDEDKVDVELDEGTWHLPETKKDMMKVIAMLKKPIPVGNEEDAYEGTEAEVGRKLNALGKAKIPIGDDEFYDNAYMLFKRKGANADLRPVAIEALARLGVISKAGTAMNAISDIQKRIKSMNEKTLGEELTMMSHGGEQTHIISGMKHNQHNADKAMHATVHLYLIHI